MLSFTGGRASHYSTFRRQHERKIYNAEIVFSIDDQIFQGSLRDISVGGAFIHTKLTHMLYEGDMAIISIPYTDGSRHVKRSGRILWKNSTGFAVSFSY